jgi:hypothetical protein
MEMPRGSARIMPWGWSLTPRPSDRLRSSAIGGFASGCRRNGVVGDMIAPGSAQEWPRPCNFAVPGKIIYLTKSGKNNLSDKMRSGDSNHQIDEMVEFRTNWLGMDALGGWLRGKLFPDCSRSMLICLTECVRMCGWVFGEVAGLRRGNGGRASRQRRGGRFRRV